MKLSGQFVVEHFDKDGNLKGKYVLNNSTTIEGKNYLLNTNFHNLTREADWYIGLIDNSGWTGEASSDTLASHSGWTEFTGYSGNRQHWNCNDAGDIVPGSITSTSPSVFTMTGGGVIKGIFVASAATGTTGFLWATADFISTVTVVTSDVIRINYTINS